MGRISRTNLGWTMLALTAAACGGSTPATTSGGTTASATTGASSSAQTTSSTTAGVGGTGGAAQSTASVAAGVGGAGGGEFVCNPVAEPGSIYEATVDEFGSAGVTTMCPYRGQVMLIVNTAAV